MESAARVGLLGVEQTIKRNHDERSNVNNLFRHDTISSFRKPNPHENDIMRIMDICIFIGQSKFDQFRTCCERFCYLDLWSLESLWYGDAKFELYLVFLLSPSGGPIAQVCNPSGAWVEGEFESGTNSFQSSSVEATSALRMASIWVRSGN